MTEILLLLITVFVFFLGGYFYYQSTARRPFRKPNSARSNWVNTS